MSSGSNPPESKLDLILEEEFERLRGSPVRSFETSFYPYSGLTSTIRSRDSKILVRLSDLLQDAPEEVLRSVVSMLVCKLLGLKVSARDRSCYRDFVNRPAFRDLARRTRAARGGKRLTSPAGRVFDLRRLFAELNDTYFCNQCSVQHLSWSSKPTRKTLGHYDESHDTIVLSRSLDDKRVPAFVVEYVLYHEMLHAFLGDEATKSGRSIHHKRFRAAEQSYPRYREAKSFIQRYFRRA